MCWGNGLRNLSIIFDTIVIFVITMVQILNFLPHRLSQPHI
uniref:Uncharacterized protein n=1 Tax=Arundo donax TaxID=35708 RepID=A0A0A8ZCH7_ARUDO